MTSVLKVQKYMSQVIAILEIYSNVRIFNKIGGGMRYACNFGVLEESSTIQEFSQEMEFAGIFSNTISRDSRYHRDSIS